MTERTGQPDVQDVVHTDCISRAVLMGFQRSVVLVTLAGLLIIQASWFQATTSATFDETGYLLLGIDAYQRGAFGEFAAQGVAPLPVLISYWSAALVARGDSLDPEQFRFLIRVARVTHLLLVGVPLMLCVYIWLDRRHGIAAAAVGTALLVLSPNVVAHVSLATTDACFVLFALLGLAALHYYAIRPSATRFWVMALAIGAAQASKYSAVFLFPLAALVLVWSRTRAGSPFSHESPARALGATVRQLVVLGATALAILWLLHGLSVTRIFPEGRNIEQIVRLVSPESFVPHIMNVLRNSPAPAPVEGFINQMTHVQSGESAFLMGERSMTGWWFYFPLALLFKSTPAELLLAISVPLLILSRRRTFDPAVWLWSAALVMYGSLALLSALDIGVRYVLLVPVLVILWSIDGMAALARTRPRPFLVAAILVLAAQLTSAMSIAPQYLSYFNLGAGGPSEGYRLLADSNVDWGQDLPTLNTVLEHVGARRPFVAYFGTAPLTAYGLSAIEWKGDEELVVGDADWLAISATYLVGVSLASDPFSAFRGLRPSARAGYTFFLYETSRPDVQKAIATAQTKLRRSEAGST